MSDPHPTIKSDLHMTPKGAAPPKKQPDTPFLPISSEGPLAGFKTAGDCKAALKVEFKKCTTTLSEEKGLAWLATVFKDNGLTGEYYTKVLKYLQDNGHYSKGAVKRWTNIPVKPKSEDALYVPFKDTIEMIIAKLREDKILTGIREAKVTASTLQKHRGDSQTPAAGDDKKAHKTKPDLLVVGQDSKFLPKNFKSSESSDLYNNAVVVLEVKREESRETKDNIRAQLAMYARQCFLQQSGRRAVYGVFLTERHFQLVVFDHSGAMESHLVNIHAKPVIFIQCICFIIGLDLSKVGFDPSVHYEDNGSQQRIKVLHVEVSTPAHPGSGICAEKLVTYEVAKLQVVSHTRSIRGPGVVVRDAKEPGVNGAEVRIVDRWVHERREKEVEIYKRAVEAGVKGLVPIKAAQKIDANVSTAAVRCVIDTDFHQNDGQLFPNLVLARVVLEGGYRSITHFKSHMELLEAYRESVKVHQELLGKGQILHRNIQSTSVLIGKENTEGGRKGFLSDLSMAVMVGRSSTLMGKDIRIIPPVFQSRHLLEEGVEYNHDYVEDLECFLNLILYIFLEYEEPGRRLSKRSELIIAFESQSAFQSRGAKGSFISHMATIGSLPASTALAAYFNDEVFTTLLADLCIVVWDFGIKKKRLKGLTPGDNVREEMYKNFIDAIDKAIVEIGNSPPKGGITAVAKPDSTQSPTAPPEHKSPSFAGHPGSKKPPNGDGKPSTRQEASNGKKSSTNKRSSDSSKKPTRKKRARHQPTGSTDAAAGMGADNTMRAREDVPTGSKRKLEVPPKGKGDLGLRCPSKRIKSNARTRLSSPIDLSHPIGVGRPGVAPDSPSAD